MPVDADGRLVPPPPKAKAPAEEEVSEANRGALASQTASILMKLLYAARVCRFVGGAQQKAGVPCAPPEAEIVAADFAMARLGLPAITLWQQLGSADPNFVFYDDNQTMIMASALAGCTPYFRRATFPLPTKSLPR